MFVEGIVDFAFEEVFSINQRGKHNAYRKSPGGSFDAEDCGDDTGDP